MGSIEDQHLHYWHELVKNDVGSKRFHLPSLLFYLLGLGILIVNIFTHVSNGAYIGVILTLVIHFASAWMISLFYKRNETVIDEDNVTFQRNEAKWNFFRGLSQALAITPLFRICANWEDQAERHETMREQKILRKEIDEHEIHAAVVNKKRSIVKAYFDCIDAMFKTIPQCILQIYIAFDLSLPLRFCTWTDCARLLTIGWSIIATSRATASYASSLAEYLKALEFQDYFTYGASMNLNPPKRHLWWITFFMNLVVVGSRIYVLAYLLTFGGGYAPILMLVMFVVYFLMVRIDSRARLCYENPPLGISNIWSELLDRYINIFSFHMIDPGFITNWIYQVTFGAAFFLFKTVIDLDMFGLQALRYNRYLNYTTEMANPRSVCNFSLFSNSRSKISRVFHHVLNRWDDYDTETNVTATIKVPSFTSFQFVDIFSNFTVCIVLLGLSMLVSNLYIAYIKLFRLSEHKFPLQTSLRAWEDFLANGYKNSKGEGGKSLEKALQILIFGVLDTPRLELMNYSLPNSVSQLIEFIQICVEENAVKFSSGAYLANDLEAHLNPCQASLKEFISFIKENKAGEETEILCQYFENSFYTCMKEMTSLRIAQTKNSIYSRRSALRSLANFNAKLLVWPECES